MHKNFKNDGEMNENKEFEVGNTPPLKLGSKFT